MQERSVIPGIGRSDAGNCATLILPAIENVLGCFSTLGLLAAHRKHQKIVPSYQF